MTETVSSIRRSTIYGAALVAILASANVLSHASGKRATSNPENNDQQTGELRFRRSLNSDWRFKRQADPGAAIAELCVHGGGVCWGRKAWI